jgi:aryl-alcohol dehydrogenase
MTMDIRAAVVRAPRAEFSVEKVRLDAPRDHEVLVELVATGICHTDIAIVEQLLPLPLPYVLGHEGAGVVLETGRAVTGLAKGDHVVLTFGSCGDCRDCNAGHPAYCKGFPAANFAGRRADGSATIVDAGGQPLNAAFFGQSSFATHAIAPARNAIKVRRDAPLRLLGPLGCGLMTGAGTVLNVLKPGPDATFAIFGSGALGFAALLAARISGCRRIVAVDRVRSRLDLARELGATETIDTSETDLAAALAAVGGIDRALDTTGVPKIIEAAAGALKPCGELALVGASHERSITLDVMSILSGRVIRGVTEGDSDPARFIPYLVDQFMSGAFPIDRLVGFYPFERINDAVKAGLSGHTIKPVIEFR